MEPIPPTGAHTRENRLHLSRVHVHGRTRLTSTTLAPTAHRRQGKGRSSQGRVTNGRERVGLAEQRVPSGLHRYTRPSHEPRLSTCHHVQPRRAPPLAPFLNHLLSRELTTRFLPFSCIPILSSLSSSPLSTLDPLGSPIVPRPTKMRSVERVQVSSRGRNFSIRSYRWFP